jgi:hypothetical protein
MTPVEDAVVEDLADLYVIEREVRSKPARERLGRMAQRKTVRTRGLRKASAARLLGVSVNTLDKWVARGSLPLVPDPRTGRPLVDIRGFVPVYVKVRDLRAAGRQDGVIAAAVSELEREDRNAKTPSIEGPLRSCTASRSTQSPRTI